MRVLSTIVAAVIWLAVAAQPSYAQKEVAVCELYRGNAQSFGISSDLLQDYDTAARCLEMIFEENNTGRADINTLREVTGALLRMIDLADTGQGPNEAVQAIRDLPGDLILDLAWGVQHPDDDLRRNSTLVLANVIDNSNACFVIDQLAAPTITENSRVNLLGILSIIAPTAVAENYEALTAVATYFLEVSGADPAMEDTRMTAANLLSRLRFQDKLSPPPRDTVGSEDLRTCRIFRPDWAGEMPYWTYGRP
jgi:hypothetical protein